MVQPKKELHRKANQLDHGLFMGICIVWQLASLVLAYPAGREAMVISVMFGGSVVVANTATNSVKNTRWDLRERKFTS